MDPSVLYGFFLVVILLFALVILARSARIVRQYEKGLVMRLGKFHAITRSGLAIIMPIIDDMIRVDMREPVISVPPQKLITKDNVTVEVDAVVYYKVVDPVKSQFEVQDFGYACTTLAQTNLRNLIGDRTLDEMLVARDMINTNLRHVLDEATNNWGVKATRVEVQKIDPPRDITEAMSRQMKAERDKRAAVLEADGIKQSQILQAEGKKQSEILKAEGDAQARITRANAEAEAIRLVSTAAETFFKERAETMRKLEVLNNTLAQNTKYIVPSNAGLVNISRSRRRVAISTRRVGVSRAAHGSLGPLALITSACEVSGHGRTASATRSAADNDFAAIRCARRRCVRRVLSRHARV